MTRDLRDRKTNRRAFLRDVAVAGGLAAVAGASGAANDVVEPKADAPAKQRTGYRVTPHVAKYYDKARL